MAPQPIPSSSTSAAANNTRLGPNKIESEERLDNQFHPSTSTNDRTSQSGGGFGAGAGAGAGAVKDLDKDLDKDGDGDGDDEEGTGTGPDSRSHVRPSPRPRVRNVLYRVGERVMVKSPRGLQGPFTITCVYSDATYKLEDDFGQLYRDGVSERDLRAK